MVWDKKYDDRYRTEQELLEKEFISIFKEIEIKREVVFNLRQEMVSCAEKNGIPFIDLDGSVYKPDSYKFGSSKFYNLDDDVIASLIGCSREKFRHDADDTGWSHSSVCW